MKKILLLAVALSSIVLLQAQGIYQLWGTTTAGGKDNAGVIFNTDANGNHFNLRHQFTATPSIGYYYSAPIKCNGKFYGMTSEGGTHSMGGIFEWDSAANTYSIKKNFDGTNGKLPLGNLTLKAGKFYGMTSAGGSYDGGVIFEWNPATNIFTRKYNFNTTDYQDGYAPSGSLTLYGSRFYGTASSGGNYGEGVIFEWNPTTNIYCKKFNFQHSDWDGFIGRYPKCDLTLYANKFYGMAQGDLYPNDYSPFNKGVIFEWNPVTNVYVEKYSFDSSELHVPFGSLQLFGGRFYGMTENGGTYGFGGIFEWNPTTAGYNTKFEFNNTNGITPFGKLALSGDTFYGVSNQDNDGNKLASAIFEWTPSTNTYTQKIIFDSNYGGNPISSLQYSGGKFYGLGTNVIFEFDPTRNTYIKKHSFNYWTGNNPYNTLTLSDGKLYGITSFGRVYLAANIFEYDLATDIYSPRQGYEDYSYPRTTLTFLNGKFYFINVAAGGLFEWDPESRLFTDRSFEAENCWIGVNKNLTAYNSKLYGISGIGGTNNAGVIYEFDPAINQGVVKKNLDTADHFELTGGFSIYNGKFYGITYPNIIDPYGAIVEWNPVTNLCSKKYSFSETDGYSPLSNLTLSNGKFYGVIERGGSNESGVLFEWDPVSNHFSKKMDFNGINGSHPSSSLTLAPAPVSNGLPGSCSTLPSVTINSSNNNQWVAITDEEGNAVAEIKANGNNLGIVTAAIFVNNITVREDANKKLYLDRSITITPQFQPATAVDIRLYIKGSEYTALKNAVNSIGQTSGIDSINDIRIYKVNSGCLPAVSTLTNLVTTVAGTWENDYVLSASISSFSSFYFAGKAAVCSAPVITQVHANPSQLWPPNHQFKNVTVNYTVTGTCPPFSSWLTVNSNEPLTGTGCGDAAPDWIITDNHHLKLRAERAGHGNGRVYTITVNTKNAAGNIAAKKTTVTVPHHQGCSNSKGSYDADGYIDANGDYFDHWFDCTITPNPSSQSFNLQVATASSEKIGISIFDLAGRLIQQLYTVKSQSLRFGDHLKPGMYMITVTQGQQQQIIKVIKQ